MIFTILVFVAAAAKAFLIFFKVIDNNTAELIIAITILAAAFITAIIALISKQVKSLIKVVAVISILIAAGALTLSFF